MQTAWWLSVTVIGSEAIMQYIGKEVWKTQAMEVRGVASKGWTHWVFGNTVYLQGMVPYVQLKC